MNISPAITQTLSRTLLKAKKHSPLIMTVAGVAGLVGAGILAARATLKLEETVDKGHEAIEDVKDEIERGDKQQGELTRTLVKNAISIGKLYWMPVTLGGVSVVLILSGHRILSQRNAALAVAYKGLETAFNNYRARVVEAYGADVDQNFRLGVRTEEVKGEDGKKQKQLTVDESAIGDYLFDFNPENGNWVPNHDHNMFFLTSHQTVANDLLRARGHLFLSEVLDMIGIDRTPASIVTGWLWDPEHEKGEGDNFIDFGIKDMWTTNGYILLDFNVDGTIFDKIA